MPPLATAMLIYCFFVAVWVIFFALYDACRMPIRPPASFCFGERHGERGQNKRHVFFLSFFRRTLFWWLQKRSKRNPIILGGSLQKS